jgi:large subunit ribosomal protein L25
MSTQVTLNVQRRDGTGKGAARKLRSGGRVPGVVYGRDAETFAVSVDAKEAEYLFHAITVENTIVELKVEGDKQSFPTLVREIQVHPARPALVHVDFYRIQKGVKVDVEIPVHLEGIPQGVKLSGGMLQQVIHELPVRVLPSDIPDSVAIDVTGLDIGDAIHVSDLDLGEGVEILIDLDHTVATVMAPRAIVEEEAEEEIEGAEEGIEGVGAAEGDESTADES